MNKYQIYCETDNKFEEVIASSEPTQCPIDGAHSVRANSVSMIERDVEVNDGTLKDLSLADYKKLRINEIDSKTQELIFTGGFNFDSQNFLMTPDAQANWIGLKSMEALLTFPLEITTSDDQAYSLTQANLNAFCGTALGTKQSYLDSGRSLKIQVNDAIDEAGVDFVVDNR